MAPGSYILTLTISAWALLLVRKEVDAFVQPQATLFRGGKTPVIMRDRISESMRGTIMSAAVERRAFVTHVISGVCAGALGLGLATERASAYEKEYLKEPTAEFKAMEARQTEFAAVQRAYKQEFVKKLDAFLAVTTDEGAVSTLNAMSNTVVQRGGLPESVRINDLLKTCRRKKAELKEGGQWTTPVQIAYETLVQTTNKTVVPLQSGG